MRAFLFPGQGSQKLKMGLDLYENFAVAKEVFDEVDDVTSQKLTQIIFGDDEDLLNKTENTQIALLATSIAVLRVIENQSGRTVNELCDMVAGHSMGEYSALVAAGTVSLSNAAILLDSRSKAMANAVSEGVGAMMAIIGLSIEEVQKVADKASTKSSKCSVANDNCPGQVVLSGNKDAIERAVDIAKEIGAKKCVILPVSIPAHCPLMESAQKILENVLAEINFKNPVIPFVSNRTANVETDSESIKQYLAEQMVNGVRFRESVDFMVSKGITEFVEIGPGNVLAGLVKRCTDKATFSSVGTVESINVFLETL